MSSEKTLPAKNVMVHMALLFVETLSTLITDAMADNVMTWTKQTDGYYDFINEFQSCNLTGEERIQKSILLVNWLRHNNNRVLVHRKFVENTWDEFTSDGSSLQDSLRYILPRIRRSGKQIMTHIAQFLDNAYLVSFEDDAEE